LRRSSPDQRSLRSYRQNVIGNVIECWLWTGLGLPGLMARLP
jgi:hypothetical protein